MPIIFTPTSPVNYKQKSITGIGSYTLDPEDNNTMLLVYDSQDVEIVVPQDLAVNPGFSCSIMRLSENNNVSVLNDSESYAFIRSSGDKFYLDSVNSVATLMKLDTTVPSWILAGDLKA